MANYREVYQPPADEGSSYDLRDDDYDEPRGRLPLLIVIGLLVLGAFAGTVWLAYQQGIERGRAVAGAPTVIAAPAGPARTAPEEAGGVPYTGLKIYEDPVPPDQEAETSILAQNPVAELADLPEPPPPAPAPPPPAAAAPAQAAAPATSGSAVSGVAVLQVGAFPSEVEAMRAWADFQAAHGGLVGDLSEDIQMADLGERGVWYRVRIGPFETRDSASSFCEQLQRNGASCFVAAP